MGENLKIGFQIKIGASYRKELLSELGYSTLIYSIFEQISTLVLFFDIVTEDSNLEMECLITPTPAPHPSSA